MESLNFLEGLKKAVDTGDFNSEVAKHIVDISELADKKIISSDGTTNENRLAKLGVKNLSGDEQIALNSEYEKSIEKIRKEDIVNKQLATLIEIEDMVVADIKDMLTFTKELKEKFGEEFEANDPIFINFLERVNNIDVKYNHLIINN